MSSKSLPVILYLTYDGLLDPLGSSQILPYLKRLCSSKYSIHIVSFEKSDRFSAGGYQLLDDLARHNIRWTPLRFTNNFGLLGKLFDFFYLHYKSLLLSFLLPVSVVHCRTHGPAQVGLLIKFLTGASLIFDFRGLWADERIDKGLWKLTNKFHLLQYKYYKFVEKFVLSRSDHIVVLTQIVKRELIKLYNIQHTKFSVIPCCADFTHFKPLSRHQRDLSRSRLNLPTDGLVFGYLGSIGGMYMCKQYLELLYYMFKAGIDIYGLILTPDISDFESYLSSFPSIFRTRLVYRYVSRDDVAIFLPAMDILTSFITSTYARQGASPTKLAEAWACGVPTISSCGVGDVTSNTRLLDSGVVIDPNNRADFDYIISNISEIISKGGPELRSRASSEFSLETGASRYSSIYESFIP